VLYAALFFCETCYMQLWCWGDMYASIFECPFSITCWNFIGILWNPDPPCLDMVLQATADFGRSFFMEILITACWTIWTSRNRLIFDAIPCSFVSWKENFENEIGLVCIKAKPSLAGALRLWLESALEVFAFSYLGHSKLFVSTARAFCTLFIQHY